MIGKPFFVLQHLQTDWIESVSNHLFQRGEICGGAVRLAKGSENGLLSYYRKCSEKHEPLALSWGETSDKVRSNTVQSRSFLSHNPPGNQEANQDAAIVTTCCAWEINYSPLLVCSLCFLLNESMWVLQDRCSLTKIFFFSFLVCLHRFVIPTEKLLPGKKLPLELLGIENLVIISPVWL